MRLFFSFLLVLFSTVAFAQTTVGIPGPDTLVFEKVEIDARVNSKEWIKHLEKKLQPVIVKAAKNGMARGKYVVNVRFLIEKDGSISEATALNDPGMGLAKSSEDVVKSGPKWEPGEVNGRKVRSYHVQPIVFMISGK